LSSVFSLTCQVFILWYAFPGLYRNRQNNIETNTTLNIRSPFGFVFLLIPLNQLE
jgi:hypothetical protein